MQWCAMDDNEAMAAHGVQPKQEQEMATTTQAQMIEAYKAAKAAGANQQRATFAVMDLGADMQQAAKVCWLVETGKAGPSRSHLAVTQDNAEE